jgi:hypothetical protein
MQTDVIEEAQPDVAQSESPQANPYTEALNAVEAQLVQLDAAFVQLDSCEAKKTNA